MKDPFDIKNMFQFQNCEQRPLMRIAEGLKFLVKAYFLENQASVVDCFPDEDIVLDDIAYYMREDKLDFMFIVSVDGLQYLMNSDFAVVSDGYNTIIQLHDKTPYVAGYIVGKESDFIFSECTYGVIDQFGKEIIPCKYYHIKDICFRRKTGYWPDAPGGVDYRCNELLFFSCRYYDVEKCEFSTHVYLPDGSLVFKDIGDLRITEERTRYAYSRTEDATYDETTTLEKFEVRVDFPDLYDENGNRIPVYYAGCYQYSIVDNYPEIDIVCDGPDAEWGRVSAELEGVPSPEEIGPILPIVNHVNLDNIGNRFKLEPALIAALIRKITSDENIYEYVDPYEIDMSWDVLLMGFGKSDSKPVETEAEKETEPGEKDFFDDPDFDQMLKDILDLDDIFEDSEPAREVDASDIFSKDFVPYASENLDFYYYNCRVNEDIDIKRKNHKGSVEALREKIRSFLENADTE